MTELVLSVTDYLSIRLRTDDQGLLELMTSSEPSLSDRSLVSDSSTIHIKTTCSDAQGATRLHMDTVLSKTECYMISDARGAQWPTIMNATLQQLVSNPEHMERFQSAAASGSIFRCLDIPIILQKHFINRVCPSIVLQGQGSQIQAGKEPLRVIRLTMPSPLEKLHIDTLPLIGKISNQLFSQYHKLHREVDLEANITLRWLSLNLSLEDSRHIIALFQLADSLRERFLHSQNPSDPKEAIKLLRSAFEYSKAGDDYEDIIFDTLAKCILSVVKRKMVMDTLDDTFQWLGLLTNDRLPKDPLILSNLGAAFAEYFMIRQSIEALTKAVSFSKLVLQRCSKDEPQYWLLLHNSATYSRLRYNHVNGGGPEDLEDALHYSRKALIHTKNLKDKPMVLLGLSDAVAQRYLETDRIEDLEELISLHREAILLAAVDHPLRFAALSMLANSLAMLYNATGSISYLDDSIKLQQEGIDLYSTDQSMLQMPVLLCQLAYFFRSRAEASSEDNLRRSMLDQAINVSLRAVEESGDTYMRGSSLFSVVESYRRRFHLLKGESPDYSWNEALRCALELLEWDEKHGGQRGDHLGQLANLYLTPGPLFDLIKGLRYLNSSVDDTGIAPQLRIRPVLSIINSVLESISSKHSPPPPDLLEVCLKVTRLQPQAAFFGLDIKSRLEALRPWQGISTFTAHLLTLAFRYTEAVEIIEEGRGIFWQQALKLRTQFDDIPKELRQPLSVLSRQLETESYGWTILHLTPVEAELKAARKRKESEEFNALLNKVRLQAPFQNFLLPEKWETLAKASLGGPVIVLTAGYDICVVYVIHKYSEGSNSTVTPISLDGVTDASLRRLVGNIEADRSRGRDVTTSEDNIDYETDTDARESERAGVKRKGARGTSVALQILWEKIVRPILVDALQLQPASGRNRPRLWWCPTGTFNFLPMHAAGIYTKGGISCSDFVVSSYTPTLMALINARKSFKPINPQKSKVLLAAVPKTNLPGWAELPGTAKELQNIKNSLPKDVLIQLDAEDDAARCPQAGARIQTIVEHLPSTSILHLACHGKQDHNSPLDSGFIMRDGVLTISKLMPLPLPHAFLAFMSACETVKGDEKQADQMIHLGATMLFAGFKSVVGTMWFMNDWDGPRIAHKVYEEIFSHEELDPDVVAYALDNAARALREENVSWTRWAPFVHLGI